MGGPAVKHVGQKSREEERGREVAEGGRYLAEFPDFFAKEANDEGMVCCESSFPLIDNLKQSKNKRTCPWRNRGPVLNSRRTGKYNRNLRGGGGGGGGDASPRIVAKRPPLR